MPCTTGNPQPMSKWPKTNWLHSYERELLTYMPDCFSNCPSSKSVHLVFTWKYMKDDIHEFPNIQVHMLLLMQYRISVLRPGLREVKWTTSTCSIIYFTCQWTQCCTLPPVKFVLIEELLILHKKHTPFKRFTFTNRLKSSLSCNWTSNWKKINRQDKALMGTLGLMKCQKICAPCP